MDVGELEMFRNQDIQIGLKPNRKNKLKCLKIKFGNLKWICTFALPFGEVGEWLKPTVC